MVTFTNSLIITYRKDSMKVNLLKKKKKTAKKISKTSSPLNIQTDNDKVSKVQEFKYLGSYNRDWKSRQRDRNKMPKKQTY